VLDFDTALGEQFLDVAVGQAKAQVAADGDDDYIGGKRKPAKADRGTRAAPGRRVLMPAVWVLERGHSECNSGVVVPFSWFERFPVCPRCKELAAMLWGPNS
jgi:hypothetical protein